MKTVLTVLAVAVVANVAFWAFAWWNNRDRNVDCSEGEE